MKRIWKFDRCIYCFEKKEKDVCCCPRCGYSDERGGMPGWWLMPGSILKGRYVTGKALEESSDRLIYLGWDLRKECRVELVEYFPKESVKRDARLSDRVSCIPGKELTFDIGKQSFFEKAKLFYKCTAKLEPLEMDFFVRNETCYYVRKKSERIEREIQKE